MLWVATPFAMLAIFAGTTFIGGSLHDPLGLTTIEAMETLDYITALFAFTLPFVPFVVMVVVTWKWLTGKER